MSWGRGWGVSVRKAIYQHERARAEAARILATECGTRHDWGTRKDLCPLCQAMAAPARRDEHFDSPDVPTVGKDGGGNL